MNDFGPLMIVRYGISDAYGFGEPPAPPKILEGELTHVRGVPVQPILKFISDMPYTNWFPKMSNSVSRAMPPRTPSARVRAIMRTLGRYGYITGCHCGCKGDYRLTEKGRAALKPTFTVRVVK